MLSGAPAAVRICGIGVINILGQPAAAGESCRGFFAFFLKTIDKHEII